MTALDRIRTTPLDIDVRGDSVRVVVAADKYTVALISAGMNDRARYAHLFAAAPGLLTALVALLPEVDDEIEQRKHGGNAEDWQRLEELSNAGHAAIAKAEGGAA